MSDKKWKYRILIFVLLFPLFFINVKDTHDWGDDFAQYLIQARNIVEGRKQTDNGLTLNEKEHAFAIKAYPVGFPLLISPICYFFSLEIYPYLLLLAIILFLTGILTFEYFSKKTTFLNAIILTLLFCYNPCTIDLKKQILSEIPFTFFLMLTLLWMESSYYKKNKSWIITGILFALLISIRLAGITLLIAFVLFEFNNFRRNKDKTERRKNIKIIILSFITWLFLFFLINDVLFPIHVGSLFSFYTNAFQSHEIQILNNINFYYIVSGFVFPFFGISVPSFWILFALAGWIIRSIKSPSFCEYLFPVYLLLILFYPYSDAGVRFLIPVFPILIYYCIYFINWLFSLAGNKSQIITKVIFIFLLIAYLSPLKGVISGQSETEDGPQQKEAVELFNYLKSIPSHTVIVFCRARAMALYSGHPALYPSKKQDAYETLSEFHNYKSLYLVIAKVPVDNEIYDPKLLEFISKYPDQYEHSWENSHFNVYRQR